MMQYLILHNLFWVLILTGCDGQRSKHSSSPEGERIPIVAFDSTEQKRNPTTRTTKDSIIVLTSEEQKRNLSEHMNDITISHTRSARRNAIDSIIVAGYDTFRLLTLIGRVIDKQGLFLERIADLNQQLIEGDRRSNQPSSKIVNGYTAVYSMYETLASMYALDPSKQNVKKEIDEIQLSVRQKMHDKISAMEVVASLACSGYKLLRIMMREADADETLTSSLEGVQEAYLEGDRLAQTDEDRFLNGIFRTFELSQIWAFAVDPLCKNEISDLLNGIIMQSQTAQGIDKQIAVAAEHLYAITHLVAMGQIKSIH